MRKSKIVPIDAEGRDRGKHFLIREKSAFETEKWAARALLALGRAGVEVPEEAFQAGAMGIMLAGLTGLQKLSFEDAEALLNEMMPCISFVPDATRKDPLTALPITRALTFGDEFTDGDIEELATLLTLRGEVLELHLGFSPAAVLADMAAELTSNRPATSTSRKPAARSSRPAKPRSAKSRTAIA